MEYVLPLFSTLTVTTYLFPFFTTDAFSMNKSINQSINQ